MTPEPMPAVHLEGFDHLVFAYHHEDDIAHFHLGDPRPAVTERVAPGWYLRFDRDHGEVAGIELHDLRQIFLETPFYASLFEPALPELTDRGARSLEADDIQLKGNVRDLPRATHLVMFLLGEAIAKLEALRLLELKAPAPEPD